MMKAHHIYVIQDVADGYPPTSHYPSGQAKSGKGVLNTRRNSGEARLSGLCYLWGLEGRGFPIRRL